MNTDDQHLANAQPPAPQPPLWTINDVARYVRCSTRHVANLQRAGMPFIKLGHLTRFDPDAVKRWMQTVT